MIPSLSHDREQETLEAKARWLQSLTLTERMDYLCMLTDLVLENNPQDERKWISARRQPRNNASYFAK